MNLEKITLSFLGFLIFVTFSCCVHEKNGNSSKPPESQVAGPQVQQALKILSPKLNQAFIPGEKIEIKLENSGNKGLADSLAISLEGNTLLILAGNETTCYVPSSGISPGIKRIRITGFFPEGKTENISVPVRFLSDIKPKQFTYRVLGSFPHDINAYTQGFEYHEGYFLEGTGQYGQSSLRKILPGTGDIIKSRTISPDLFGEGITEMDGKIYQVTYRSQVGFIYDAESFEQLQKFFYPNLEGWGLTNNGKEIIMSDGTNIIYFLDPQYFTVNRKIEVYDQVSEVDSLNELEYIRGVIYSNRYMTEEIVMIDPENGKVTGKVDLRGLLKPEDRHSRIDVLNGIAWDKGQDRLFVTGKNWPKIFSIELLEK